MEEIIDMIDARLTDMAVAQMFQNLARRMQQCHIEAAKLNLICILTWLRSFFDTRLSELGVLHWLDRYSG